MTPATMRRATTAVVAAGLVLVLGACSDDEPSSSSPSPSSSAPSSSASSSAASSSASSSSPASSSPATEEVLEARFDRVLARDLETPWGIAFLPDGSALVSERDTAEIKRVSPRGEVRSVGEVEDVDGGGEGGLLGLAVSPTFASDQLVFAYFTAGDENRIVRMTYDGSGLSGQRTILDNIPAGGIHNGGRIAFGPDGLLYAGTGEAGQTSLAQDRDSLGGKILRITPAGRPAPGNPFGSPVYSLGHRNVQGLAWDSRDRLWAGEFGQNTWDELNRIRRGGNYGWPEVEGKGGGGDRFLDPIKQFDTEEASPSGIAIAGGAVYMGALQGERLLRVPIPGGKAGATGDLLGGRYGRLRTVVAAPDGSLWVTTSNRDGRGDPRAGDDKILRLTLR